MIRSRKGSTGGFISYFSGFVKSFSCVYLVFIQHGFSSHVRNRSEKITIWLRYREARSNFIIQVDDGLSNIHATFTTTYVIP